MQAAFHSQYEDFPTEEYNQSKDDYDDCDDLLGLGATDTTSAPNDMSYWDNLVLPDLPSGSTDNQHQNKQQAHFRADSVQDNHSLHFPILNNSLFENAAEPVDFTNKTTGYPEASSTDASPDSTVARQSQNALDPHFDLGTILADYNSSGVDGPRKTTMSPAPTLVLPAETPRGRKATDNSSPYVRRLKERAQNGDLDAAIKLGWSGNTLRSIAAQFPEQLKGRDIEDIIRIRSEYQRKTQGRRRNKQNVDTKTDNNSAAKVCKPRKRVTQAKKSPVPSPNDSATIQGPTPNVLTSVPPVPAQGSVYGQCDVQSFTLTNNESPVVTVNMYETQPELQVQASSAPKQWLLPSTVTDTSLAIPGPSVQPHPSTHTANGVIVNTQTWNPTMGIEEFHGMTSSSISPAIRQKMGVEMARLRMELFNARQYAAHTKMEERRAIQAAAQAQCIAGMMEQRVRALQNKMSGNYTAADDPMGVLLV